jgi:hypothetical protein
MFAARRAQTLHHLIPRVPLVGEHAYIYNLICHSATHNRSGLRSQPDHLCVSRITFLIIISLTMSNLIVNKIMFDYVTCLSSMLPARARA